LISVFDAQKTLEITLKLEELLYQKVYNTAVAANLAKLPTQVKH
jgi:hypothetical protein